MNQLMREVDAIADVCPGDLVRSRVHEVGCALVTNVYICDGTELLVAEVMLEDGVLREWWVRDIEIIEH